MPDVLALADIADDVVEKAGPDAAKSGSISHALAEVLSPDDPAWARQAKLAALTDRSMETYVRTLDIPPEELDAEGHRILDVGSGTQQGLAKAVNEAGLRSQVISIDPRLALTEEEDLSPTSLFTPPQTRLLGRAMPQPGTMAAFSTHLPVADATMDNVYASYSVPYYLRDNGDVKQTMSEMFRALKPGGTARVYPIPSARVGAVQEALNDAGITDYSLQKVPMWRLIATKPN